MGQPESVYLRYREHTRHQPKGNSFLKTYELSRTISDAITNKDITLVGVERTLRELCIFGEVPDASDTSNDHDHQPVTDTSNDHDHQPVTLRHYEAKVPPTVMGAFQLRSSQNNFRRPIETQKQTMGTEVINRIISVDGVGKVDRLEEFQKKFAWFTELNVFSQSFRTLYKGTRPGDVNGTAGDFVTENDSDLIVLSQQHTKRLSKDDIIDIIFAQSDIDTTDITGTVTHYIVPQALMEMLAELFKKVCVTIVIHPYSAYGMELQVEDSERLYCFEKKYIKQVKEHGGETIAFIKTAIAMDIYKMVEETNQDSVIKEKVVYEGILGFATVTVIHILY